MTTLPGIDVSGIGQGATFDWNAWRGRIAFAFMKASEALTFRDPDFARNWGEAAKLGIVRGAYHFLHPGMSGAAQADFFLSVVDPRPGDLVMMDAEISRDEHGAGMSPAAVSATVAAFADIVRAKTGAWPVAYTDQSMARAGYLASAGQCPAFIANPSQVQFPVPIGPWRLVSFEQVGQRGVDTDVFYGDIGELRRLTVSRPLPPTPAPAPKPAPAPTPPPPPPPAPKPAPPSALAGIDITRTYGLGEPLKWVWLHTTDGGKTYQFVEPAS